MMSQLSRLYTARVCIVALTCCLAWRTCPTARGEESGPKPTSAPAPSPAKAAANAANATVKAAVDASKAEFKDAKTKPLRTKCNFITAESDEALADAVLAYLDSSGSSQESVYIKWQLLSGLPSHVKDKQVTRLIRIYTSAPALTPHPSLDARTRNQLDAAIRGKKPEAEMEKIATEWADAVQKAMAPNTLLLAYRDELFSHLPPTGDTIKAGIQDAYERASAGIVGVKGGSDGATMMTAADAVCHNWAASGASPGQLADMKGLVDRIIQAMGGAPTGHGRAGDDCSDGTAVALGLYNSDATVQTIAAVGAFPPTIYAALAKNDKGVWGWQMPKAAFVPVAKLVDLSKYLADCMKNPGGGLKFKDQT